MPEIFAHLTLKTLYVTLKKGQKINIYLRCRVRPTASFFFSKTIHHSSFKFIHNCTLLRGSFVVIDGAPQVAVLIDSL